MLLFCSGNLNHEAFVKKVMSAQSKTDIKEPVLFFDGVCGLCNRAVDFLLKIDKQHKLHFAPIQGETAKDVLPENLTENLDTVILYEKEKLYYKSDAALRSLKISGGWWRYLYYFKFLPRFIREFIYDIIAENRYDWFGKRDACRLPTPEEKKYFLD